MDFLKNTELMSILVVAVVGGGLLLFVLMVVARLYRRATKEISFVRTGFGGQKVIVNGGALVFRLSIPGPRRWHFLRLYAAPIERANN